MSFGSYSEAGVNKTMSYRKIRRVSRGFDQVSFGHIVEQDGKYYCYAFECDSKEDVSLPRTIIMS